MVFKHKFNITYFLVAFFAVLVIQNMWMQQTQVEKIAYSDFQKLMREIQISETFIQGKIKDPKEGQKIKFKTVRIDPQFAKDLEAFEVKVTGVIESTFIKSLMSWVIPTFIFIGIWLFLAQRMEKKGGFGGSFMAVGKSKAKVYVESDTKTTFRDVAGVDEAKEELKEIIDFLKDSKAYQRLGARMPKGVLLVGPPGTGKTLLAKAVAGEAAVPFFSISGSEFVEMFVGVGAARVRDLFEQARSKSPCIIFIDELDALGKSRAMSPLAGGHDEKEQTLNQLLVELDGFDTSSGIIIIAATNRPEILDPALLRAGRFDRQILVDRPDKPGRLTILQVHVKKIKGMTKDVDLDAIAAMTPGFTGADLENLANEAALIAIRRKKKKVEQADFESAIERIIAGLERKNRLLNEKERRTVAWHEMGHALVAASQPGCDPVQKVSIIPRGIGALGYTIQRPLEDRFLMTKEELENKITVLLGGRAAETITFKHHSTGASDDLSRATEIAKSMVTRYGMEEKLGLVSYEKERGNFLGQSVPWESDRWYSDDTAREIDTAIKAIIEKCFRKASGILEGEKTLLDESAQQLLEKETLDSKELDKIFKKLSKAA
ncbi:ATP-dependent zinc metalloprotease FtsH [Fibrobacterota bacterium]